MDNLTLKYAGAQLQPLFCFVLINVHAQYTGGDATDDCSYNHSCDVEVQDRS